MFTLCREQDFFDPLARLVSHRGQIYSLTPESIPRCEFQVSLALIVTVFEFRFGRPSRNRIFFEWAVEYQAKYFKMAAGTDGEGWMGRPPIGEKAMSSSERAQRYRSKKRRLSLFNKEKVTQREWLLIEAALSGPKQESRDIMFGIGLAVQCGRHLSDADFNEMVRSGDIEKIVSETTCEIEP
jgi:hypothetical protein